MLVRELLDYLKEQDPELEVELALVAPVGDDDPEITVDRFPVNGLLPWEDDETGEPMLWLVCGEDDDVDAFIDAIEPDDDGDDAHSDDADSAPAGDG